jgi:hypothetical protein
MAEKLHRLDDEQVGFFCRGCKCLHGVRVAGEGHPRRLWNGSMDSPTITPSIKSVLTKWGPKMASRPRFPEVTRLIVC